MHNDNNGSLSRRDLLRGGAVLGTALGAAGASGLGGLAPAQAQGTATGNARPDGAALAQTPPLSAEAMAALDAALGKKGSYVEAEATYTTPLPRADLKVSVQGDPVPTGLGFGGWVSIKRTLDGRSAVLMSDTVLLEEEVSPLMSAALANGLEIGAVHNHFFYEQPRIFYMHIHGMGDAAELARRYGAAIRATKLFPANQPPAATPAPGQPPARTGKEIFDLPALDAIVGKAGKVNGPAYKYTIGRDDLRVIEMGAHMTAAIGLNTWASFAGAPDAAHVVGDVAMLPHEVNPVIRALKAHNIEVVAIHSHMLSEQPRIIFLHYIGRGPASALAQGFRGALDELGKRRPAMNGMAM